MNFKISVLKKMFFALGLIEFASGCHKSNAPSTETMEIPAVYKKIYGASSITTDGTWIYQNSRFA